MTIQEIKEAKSTLLRLSANDKERMKYEDRRAALLYKFMDYKLRHLIYN